jgi:hypothetical protein
VTVLGAGDDGHDPKSLRYTISIHLYVFVLSLLVGAGDDGYDPKSLLSDPLKYPVSIWTIPEMAFIGILSPPLPPPPLEHPRDSVAVHRLPRIAACPPPAPPAHAV